MRTALRAISLLVLITAGTAHASLTSNSRGADDFLFPRSMRAQYEVKSPKVAPAGKNRLCKEALLDRVEYFGVDGFENHLNYCGVEQNLLPSDVVTVIQKIGELNSGVATALGIKKELLFPMSMNVFFKSYENGALGGSGVTGEGMILTVLPTWKAADFSTMQYAHEIIHVLNFNPGPFSEMMLGLEEHPYLVEALPDLISAVVHASPKIVIADPDLPDCIRNFRDGTPSQSLGAPFGHFYPLGSVDEVIACCEATKDLSAYAKRLCRGYVNSRPRSLAKISTLKLNAGLEFLEYTPENLKAPFEASNCVVKTPSGLTFLDNCDSHQFSQSLVSFFFRLKELTGHSQFLPFMNQIKALAPRTSQYTCGYVSASKSLGGALASVKIRPLLGAFIGLREELSPADRVQFDRAWLEHEMGKMVDLDRLYRNETFSGIAQARVGARNELYTPMFGCDNLYSFDLSRCEVSCKRVDGAGSPSESGWGGKGP